MSKFASVAVALCAVCMAAFAAEELVFAAELNNPLGNITLSQFIDKVLQAVIIILFPIIVLMILFTGFLFVRAQGNEQKLSEAKRAFLWTIIGALIVLGAQALSLAIKGTVDDIRGTLHAPANRRA